MYRRSWYRPWQGAEPPQHHLLREWASSAYLVGRAPEASRLSRATRSWKAPRSPYTRNRYTMQISGRRRLHHPFDWESVKEKRCGMVARRTVRRRRTLRPCPLRIATLPPGCTGDRLLSRSSPTHVQLRFLPQRNFSARQRKARAAPKLGSLSLVATSRRTQTNINNNTPSRTDVAENLRSATAAATHEQRKRRNGGRNGAWQYHAGEFEPGNITQANFPEKGSLKRRQRGHVAIFNRQGQRTVAGKKIKRHRTVRVV